MVIYSCICTVHIQLYMYGSYTAVSVRFIYSCICTVHIQLYFHGSYTAVFPRFIYSCNCTVHIQLYLYGSYTAVFPRFIYSCISTAHIQLYLYASYTAVSVRLIFNCISKVHIQLYFHGSYTAVFIRFIYSCKVTRYACWVISRVYLPCFHCKINNLSFNTIQEAVFCQGPNFATYSLKKFKCCIQMCLGAPFVAYEFVWGRILNKYAVISPDKQNKDRKVSACLSFT